MMIKIKINWFQQIQLQEYNGSKFHNHSKQMQEKIFWTNQEDQTLKMIIQSSKETRLEDNIDWRFTSQRLKEALSIYKTPNQCRYRWNHHLRTGLPKQPQWTHPQQIQLFELQEKLGNKWTAISSLIPDKSHTAVKNFFYGSLRKSIRLINSFISEHRNESFYKNFKLFHANCIGKIIAQEQNKKRSKMRVAKANIADSAREIKNVLLKISRDAAERDLIQQAIFCIAEFNRNCRRLRCKKAKSFDESQAECTSKHSFPEHVSKTVKESGLQQKATSKQLLSIAKKPTQYSLQKVGSALFKINELIFKQYPNQKYGTNTEADLRTKPQYVHECQEDMLLNVIKKESSSQRLRFREQSEGYVMQPNFQQQYVDSNENVPERQLIRENLIKDQTSIIQFTAELMASKKANNDVLQFDTTRRCLGGI